MKHLHALKSCPAGLQIPSYSASAGYEELKPFGFSVHAGIDGGSNYIVYATLALNNSAESVSEGYKQAIQAYGRPLRVRADLAFEGLPTGQDMLDHRGISAKGTAHRVLYFSHSKVEYLSRPLQQCHKDGNSKICSQLLIATSGSSGTERYNKT